MSLKLIKKKKKKLQKLMMKKMKDSCLVLLMIIGIIVFVAVLPSNSQFTAMYAFGDSLTDPGNNNFLNTLAKANYIPYGVDFPQGPSGRFSNGKTCIDYLGDFIGLPLLPPYTSSSASGRNLLKGVNYASAAGGILEETGDNLGECFSLSEQVENFKDTLNQMRNLLEEEEELSDHLAKALVMMNLGSNDYINNYLQPTFYRTSFIYNPKDFADLLIGLYTKQILALHKLGLRKFMLGGIGPLGCIPNQLAAALAPTGKCVTSVNDIVGIFNMKLIKLVDQLNSEHQGSVFAYGNTFDAFMNIIHNASSYGLVVIDRGCCGIGRNQGQITCLPFSVPCTNRKQYAFWDAFHPTETIHKLLAIMAYNGSSSDCYPVNVQQMAQM